MGGLAMGSMAVVRYFRRKLPIFERVELRMDKLEREHRLMKGDLRDLLDGVGEVKTHMASFDHDVEQSVSEIRENVAAHHRDLTQKLVAMETKLREMVERRLDSS